MVDVDADLIAVLDPVLGDLASAANLSPEVRESDFGGPGTLCAVLHLAGARSVGVMIVEGNDRSAQVVELADRVQEWAVEELWSARRSPVWPTCPEHPDSHPLKPVESDGRAVWICPTSSNVVAMIGSLSD
jgi:hypothetical protein